jgi:hypothetical protein
MSSLVFRWKLPRSGAKRSAHTRVPKLSRAVREKGGESPLLPLLPPPPRRSSERPPRSRKRGTKAGSVPRMAVSAVRIPRFTELEFPTSTGPQIFVHEGLRQMLERRLELAFGGPVQLAVTDNRRQMLTQRRSKGLLRVRIHMMFLGAPESVLEAVVRYIVEGDREASHLVSEFIGNNSYRIRATQTVKRPPRTKGAAHDLAAIFAGVNERYFGSGITDVLIGWGRNARPRKANRNAIKLGSYSALERSIVIHPVLDRPWVPRYFVSYIVYHELLHHVIPSGVLGGRRVLHPPEFAQREREFRQYERASAWEAKNIGRLLRAR